MGRSRELAELAASYDSGNLFGMKNRIINGAMMIDQRNAGASVTPTTNGQFTLDRWSAYLTQSSKFSVQQNAGSVTPPAGFSNYLGVTSLAATSLGASDYFLIRQVIEGLNVSDLGWGAANASSITISFWVRSSLTGTFGGSIRSYTSNYSYPFTYTISAANTWEQKFITIAGPTTGGTAYFPVTSNGCFEIDIGLGVGSTYSGAAGSWAAANYLGATGATSVVGTNGATFYITGVQLEKGSTATSFDFRPYGTELQLCQRYCYVLKSSQAYYRFAPGYNGGTTQANYPFFLPVPMRAIPSLTYSGTTFQEIAATGGVTQGTSLALTTDGNSTESIILVANFSSGTVTATAASAIRIFNSTTWYANFSAEL